MPDLLLELFSEEIPARLQAKAAADLKKLVSDRLYAAGFMPTGAQGFATPRRLTLAVEGLADRQPDRREEKKGPRVGAPDQAVEGFLRSAGLSSLDECEKREDKKGEYYVAIIEETGRPTADLIAEMVPDIIAGFPWPKSMRWGAKEMRWVRPLQSVLCVFNDEVVPFEIEGLQSSDATYGHRFMAPGEIRARDFETYAAALKAAKVVLDPAERAETIFHDAKTLCAAQGLELVEDKGLLAEVAGLVEWPVTLMGCIDEKFLELPDEVLTTSMRSHQKYFSVKDPATGRLAPRFIFVANLEAEDGGAAMRAGYERVLTARLSDGYFLYKQDLKVPLEERVAALDKITFFDRLGTIGDKVRRVAALAKEIAPLVGADPEAAERAAMLAKADLTTGMVYEFPELQGLMGRYYALAQGEPADIADAIRDHYKPAGQDDEVPSAPVSVAVALADKIDTLVGFWAIDEKPTGSKDPFALRRAALGIISLATQSELRLSLKKLAHAVQVFLFSAWAEHRSLRFKDEQQGWITDFYPGAKDDKGEYVDTFVGVEKMMETLEQGAGLLVTPESQFTGSPVYDSVAPPSSSATDLLSFFHDRLKVYLRDKGARHDLVDAVLTDADGNLQDDLVLITRRLAALETFLKTDDGANLLAAYKRAANILKAEEKKGAGATGAGVDAARFVQDEERALYDALTQDGGQAKQALTEERFEDAMTALSALRGPLDAFFEAVTVNADDSAVRDNRLNMLQNVRDSIDAVADFSKIEG